jgi:hypothetical protein
MRLAPKAVLRRIASQLPEARRRAAALREAEREFDRRYHVRTAGVVNLADMSIPSPNQRFGVRCEGIDPGDFQVLMRAFTAVADPREYTFVDLGCGLGKAMALASEFPFRRIVGVDFAPDLHAACLANLATLRAPSQQCFDLSAVRCDALDFALPTSPLALFLYNPFDEEVMAPLVRNVAASYESDRRPIVVLYDTPQHAGPWEQAGSFRQVLRTRGAAVFATPEALTRAENCATSAAGIAGTA